MGRDFQVKSEGLINVRLIASASMYVPVTSLSITPESVVSGARAGDGGAPLNCKTMNKTIWKMCNSALYEDSHRQTRNFRLSRGLVPAEVNKDINVIIYHGIFDMAPGFPNKDFCPWTFVKN